MTPSEVGWVWAGAVSAPWRTVNRNMRHVVAAAGLYEAVAIWTHRVPTISEVVHQHRRVGHRLSLVLALLWLTYHLLFERVRLVVVPLLTESGT